MNVETLGFPSIDQPCAQKRKRDRETEAEIESGTETRRTHEAKKMGGKITILIKLT